MKRLLSIIHTPVFGGPHNQMLRLDAPLRERGWDTTVLLPDEPNSSGYKRLEEAGIKTLRIPLHRLRAKVSPTYHVGFLTGFIPEIYQIRKIIHELEIDLVQICGLMNPHGAIAAWLAKVPVVWQLLGTTAPSPLRRLLMPLVTRLASVVMATGQATADAHPGAGQLNERLVLFAPPVDTHIFRPNLDARHNARRILDCTETDIVLGTVGNRNKLKGHEYLIQVTAMIRRRYRNTVTRILGGETTHFSYYDQNVRGLAERLGLLENKQVVFYDPKDSVPDLLPALDIFVLTSRIEGMPTVVLEAMASGLPIVSFDVGSTSELVQDGRTGFIVSPRDTMILAERICQLINDADLRIEMGKRARELVVQNYDINACVSKHEYAYELAIQHHKRYS